MTEVSDTDQKDRLLLLADGSELRDGDVIRYTPSPRFAGQRDVHWCHEGMAVARCGDDGVMRAVDTYWHSGPDALTVAEIATGEVIFNRHDYDEFDAYKRGSPTWERYAPEDREVITSQHRLQFRWFVRKGAAEDLPTQIQNARDRLARAEAKAKSAAWDVEWAQRQLAEIEAKASLGAVQ